MRIPLRNSKGEIEYCEVKDVVGAVVEGFILGTKAGIKGEAPPGWKPREVVVVKKKKRKRRPARRRKKRGGGLLGATARVGGGFIVGFIKGIMKEKW